MLLWMGKNNPHSDYITSRYEVISPNHNFLTYSIWS